MLLSPLTGDDILFNLDFAPTGLFAGDALYATGWCRARQGEVLPRVVGVLRRLGSPLEAAPAGGQREVDTQFEMSAVAVPRSDLVSSGIATVASVDCGFLWQYPVVEPAIVELSFTVTLGERQAEGIAPRVITVWPARYLSSPRGGEQPPQPAEDALLPDHVREALRARLAEAVSPDDVLLAVERPLDTVVAGSPLRLSGWCRHAQGMPLEGLRVRVGPVVTELEYSLPRDDVRVSAHGFVGAAHCGFTGRVEAPLGACHLELEACFMGRWLRVRTLQLTVGATRFARQALQKAGRELVGQWQQQPPGQPWRQRWQNFTRQAQRWCDDEWLPWLTSGLPTPAYGDFAEHAPKPVEWECFPRPTEASPEHRPKFSIVTPSYNQAGYLPHTLESVLSQRGVLLEYIVMDGGSKDGSAEIIEGYAHRLAHWQSAPDGGQSAAVAEGLARSHGAPDDLMAYLNSDDLLCPGALRFVADYMAAHPEVDAVYGHRIVIDHEGLETGRWITPRHDETTLLHVDLVPQETLFWRRRLYERVGGVDPSFRFALDWDLLVRFAQAGARMQRLPYFLGCFRVHAMSKTVTQSDTVGAREVEGILERTHGRTVERREVLAYWHRAQLQAAGLRWLLGRGVRW